MRLRLVVLLFLSIIMGAIESCGQNSVVPDVSSENNNNGIIDDDNNVDDERDDESINFVDPNYVLTEKDLERYPTDLVLIYNGANGVKNPQWTKDNLRPFIYRENAGKVEWQFDGFLFLQIYLTVPGKVLDVRYDNINKDLWEDIVTTNFNTGQGVDALEDIMNELKDKGEELPYKIKVVFSIPFPDPKLKNTWGTLNGDKMDFTSSTDRVKAGKWFVDEIIKKWKQKKYKNLQLKGFYWFEELLHDDQDIVVTNEMSNYLHDMNLDFYWIPYMYAKHAEDWKEAGFDIAYQQPNYFFQLDRPYSLLTDAIKFANKNNMAMEFEMNEKMIDQPEFLSRFYDYIHEYTDKEIFDNKPLAYYLSHRAWLEVLNSTNNEMQDAAKVLGDILYERKYQKLSFK